MNPRLVAAIVLVLCACAGAASGQTFSARRTGMGGVLLPGGGGGSDPVNVAYHAVPPVEGSSAELPLPIGLVPLLQHPPEFDPKQPDFNVYDLANKLYDPPWNLQLVQPAAPSSDIAVTLGSNYLALDLGDVANVFPDEPSRFGSISHLPAIGFGMKRLFVNVSALVQAQNELSLNDALLAALKRGQPFAPNTEYALHDDAKGQAAAALQLGWAGALSHPPGADAHDRSGLYVGARAKLLRGLAYGDAQNRAGFTTGDSLFSNSAVAVDYLGHTRSAMPRDGGWGQGFDLGAVWIASGLEVGLGASDVGSRVSWKVEQSIVQRDSVTGDVKSTVIARDVPFTSQIPATVALTVARRLGGTLLAADAVHGMFDTTFHAGAEHWMGPIAVRAGGSRDADRRLQYSCGLGAKVGRFGVDAGLATNSDNLTHERGVELCVGLALYH